MASRLLHPTQHVIGDASFHCRSYAQKPASRRRLPAPELSWDKDALLIKHGVLLFLISCESGPAFAFPCDSILAIES